MRLNKFSLFLVFFLFTFSSFAQSNNYFYGSFESNGVYYQESESTDYDKKFASNTYLNLKYNLNNYKNAKADYLKCLDIELCQRADVNLILGKLEVMLGNNEIAASYFKNAIILSKNIFKVLSEALSFFKSP